MQIYRDEVTLFLEDKLSLKGIRSGTHTIYRDSGQYQHFVDLILGVELNYYSHVCYLGTLHSIERHSGADSISDMKIRAYIYVPGLDNLFYMQDISATGDPIQQALSSVNLVSIRRKLAGAYRLNMEINSRDALTRLSFDMSTADESLKLIKSRVFSLIEFLARESDNPILREFIKTRQLPNRG